MADVHQEPPFSICLLVSTFHGELEFAHRMEKACSHLGWNFERCDIDAKPVHNHDCTIILQPTRSKTDLPRSYLALFAPGHIFFDGSHLKERERHHLGYLPSYEDRSFLLQDVPAKAIYPYPWYPTVQARPYVKVRPKKLFHILAAWGSRRENPKYQQLLKKLGKSGYAHFFAAEQKLGDPYGKAYRGRLPFNGESVVDQMSKLGVCLILHSQIHLRHAIPSGRIFEAAAASAVIISDRNRFVMDHFGDSVLYIDEKRSGIEMFQEIDQYMQWIRKHPREAIAMAHRAHTIFEEQFLLEEQLLQFRQFHEQRMAEESVR